jgi:hypothetical protein
MKLHNIVVIQVVILLSVSCSSAATIPSPTPFPYTPISTLLPETTLSVELLSAEYVGTGEGCLAIIHLHVSGSPVTGYFRVTNGFYNDKNPPYDSGYPLVTLQVGSNAYQVGLGGNGNPDYYIHDVWFEYNGISSNRLTGLICPGLTTQSLVE